MISQTPWHADCLLRAASGPTSMDGLDDGEEAWKIVDVCLECGAAPSQNQLTEQDWEQKPCRQSHGVEAVVLLCFEGS
jgi:hypothetical protein